MSLSRSLSRTMLDYPMETTTENQVSPERDSALGSLISRLNGHEMYINHLKNTQFCCCCCNLWVASHFWLVMDIVMRICSSIWSLSNNNKQPLLENLAVTGNIVVIGVMSLALYGVRNCQPDYIGALLFMIIVGVIWITLSIPGLCVIESDFVLYWLTSMVLAWVYGGWMSAILFKVYGIAKTHKKGKDSYLNAQK